MINFKCMDKIIGQLIEERVKSVNMDVTEFAKQIGRERTNVYNIFKRSRIDTGLLKKIGQVLEYDFFIIYLLTSHRWTVYHET